MVLRFLFKVIAGFPLARCRHGVWASSELWVPLTLRMVITARGTSAAFLMEVCYAQVFAISATSVAFEVTCKRRQSFPSEIRVARGLRFVHVSDVELTEKLGRNDLCPCGSGRRFQGVLPRLLDAMSGSSRHHYFQGVMVRSLDGGAQRRNPGSPRGPRMSLDTMRRLSGTHEIETGELRPAGNCSGRLLRPFWRLPEPCPFALQQTGTVVNFLQLTSYQACQRGSE